MRLELQPDEVKNKASLWTFLMYSNVHIMLLNVHSGAVIKIHYILLDMLRIAIINY